MDEIWADIPGYEGMYQISTHGRVKSLPRTIRRRNCDCPIKERILRPASRNGYLHVNLCNNKNAKSAFIHRLVAIIFIPNPRGVDCINHKDCNPHNNRVENLEWCTKAENNQHAWDNGCQEKLRGIMKQGLRNRAVLQLDLNGNVIKQFDTIKEASAETGATHSHISSCCRNRYGRRTCGGYKWQYSN
jgi:hypothetical protein